MRTSPSGCEASPTRSVRVHDVNLIVTIPAGGEGNLGIGRWCWYRCGSGRLESDHVSLTRGNGGPNIRSDLRGSSPVGSAPAAELALVVGTPGLEGLRWGRRRRSRCWRGLHGTSNRIR